MSRGHLFSRPCFSPCVQAVIALLPNSRVLNFTGVPFLFFFFLSPPFLAQAVTGTRYFEQVEALYIFIHWPLICRCVDCDAGLIMCTMCTLPTLAHVHYNLHAS